MKRGIFLFAVALLTLPGQAQSLVINELVYVNKSALTDHEGDSPDWFELYNAGDERLNLKDYSVTDGITKESYWVFPDIQLLPHEYLVVFASGKDTIFGNEMHTGFKLSPMKDTLYLLNPHRKIIDRIDPICVPANKSLSRVPDGSDNRVVTLPTPGNSNNASQAIPIHYTRDSLSVNMESGIYPAPLSIVLQNHVPGNTIMYTTDGDDPDEGSDVYSQAITLKDRTSEKNRLANKVDAGEKPGDDIYKANILRAVVYSDGCPASNEINNTYFISVGSAGNHYQVPLVSLITDKDNLFDKKTGIYTTGVFRNFDQHGSKWERPVHIEMFDSTGVQILDQDAGVRIHGRGSRRAPQKSLRLYARDKYGAGGFDYPFFSQKPSLNHFRVLLLRNVNGDLGPLFKEELCNSLVSGMDVDYQACETVILFINGEYWGIYNLMERENREYIEDNYKITVPEVDVISYDRKLVVEDGTMDAYNNFIDYLQQAHPESEDFYEEVNKKIDLREVMDYYSAKLYLADIDWPQSNVELWRIKADTARWRYFLFDSDAAMDWLSYDQVADYNNDIDRYQQFDEFSTIILRTLLKNERFRREFTGRFYGYLNTTFSASRVLGEINRFEKKYGPLVEEHVYRWHYPDDYKTWEQSVSSLRQFAVQRPLIMTRQLQNNFGTPFRIFPNPCRGDFYIDFYGETESASLKVYAADGKLVRQWQNLTLQKNISFVHTGLPNGIYILQLSADGMTWYNKIIIQ
jgi:hypothetical protein